MLITLTILIYILSAFAVIYIRLTQSRFRFTWHIASVSSLLALVGIFFWQLEIPKSITLINWQVTPIFGYAPTWIIDRLSWPYAISLATLAVGVIFTSVVRKGVNPLAWAGTLLLTALGILATLAATPYTLIILWAAIDLVELGTMLVSVDGESQSERVVIAFAARLGGIGLMAWASVLSIAEGSILDFGSIPAQVDLYLLLAAALRLGVVPLHLPYRGENVIRRGFGTILRLISAASSLALLARIPAGGLHGQLTPILIILTAFTSLYSGWMWMRSSDELTGRPFWILGIASLSVGASLIGSPMSSVGWGVVLILGGGFIFLYSARSKALIWLVILATLGLTSLPYTISSSSQQINFDIPIWNLIIFLPGQALLLAGLFRHGLHLGELNIESFPPWEKSAYTTGLSIIIGVQSLLGIWVWAGAQVSGSWWSAVIVVSIAIVSLTPLRKNTLTKTAEGVSTRLASLTIQPDWIYKPIWPIYRLAGRTIALLSDALEGEAGMLWSLLILVILISIYSLQIR